VLITPPRSRERHDRPEARRNGSPAVALDGEEQ